MGKNYDGDNPGDFGSHGFPPLGKTICSHGSDLRGNVQKRPLADSNFLTRNDVRGCIFHHCYITMWHFSAEKKHFGSALPPWSPVVGHEFLLQRKEENSNVGCQECQKDCCFCVFLESDALFSILFCYLFYFDSQKNICEGLSQYLKYFAGWMLLRLAARLRSCEWLVVLAAVAPCH